MNLRGRVYATFAVVCLSLLSLSVLASNRVGSERSHTRPAPALQWKLSTFQAIPAAAVRYPEISVARIHDASRKNAQAGQQLQQIGIGRFAARDATVESPRFVRWVPLRGGGSVARVEYTSPLALAMRVGLRVGHLSPGVELRFAGSDRPAFVVAKMGVAQMRRLADRNGIFWTPSTDGQTQIMEIYRPRGVQEQGASLQAPIISHLLGNSRNSFTLSKALGEADRCQIDAACKVDALGPDFVEALASTAFVQYITPSTGAAYGCTFTLIADKVPDSQIPYAVAVVPCGSDVLTNPGSANSFWGYEATGCGSGVARTPVQLSGGAVELHGAGYGDVASSGVLLRLNEPAPAGAVFAGWDTAPLVPGEQVLSIHHPRGDVKKVVSGVFRGTSAYTHNVGWVGGGYMESGSWGAGLFTADADGYHLRGFARNGALVCSQTFLLNTSGNTQNFGRMDLLYPFMRKWLAPDEIAPGPDFDYVVDGRTVTFTPRTESTMYGHEWSMGQGYFSAKTLVHTFAAPGFYRVTLRVKVEGGSDQYVSHVVPVEQNVRVNGSSPRVRGRPGP